MNEENMELNTSQSTVLQSFIRPVSGYWKLALLIWLLVLAFVFCKSYFARRYYQVTFFISCNYPVAEDLKIAGNSLKVYNDPSFSQAEMKTLASNYTSEIINSEPSIRQLSVNTSRVTRENNSYELILQSYDSSRIIPLVSDFVGYLNKNAYLSEILKRERKQYENILKAIDARLSEGRSGDEATLKSGTAGTYGIDLIEKREAVLSRLDKIKGFEISVPPAIPKGYANLPMLKQMVLAAVWGAILAVAIAFFAAVIWPKKN